MTITLGYIFEYEIKKYIHSFFGLTLFNNYIKREVQSDKS